MIAPGADEHSAPGVFLRALTVAWTARPGCGRLQALAGAVSGSCGEAQKGHLRAKRGMSLRHSVQGRVSDSTSGWVLRRRVSALIGWTTRKNTAAAIDTNEIR